MRGIVRLVTLGGAFACALGSVAVVAGTVDRGAVEIGRRIYEAGVLSSGAPLEGVRRDGSVVSGEAAACATCHRRSGMGSVEGDIQVPPISANYLFKLSRKALATMDPHVGKAMNLAHPAYTEASLARAIRAGIDSSGREMGVPMPRFTLGEADFKALSAYLGQLSRTWSPGVSAESIRLATVVAPGVEPERRRAFVDMMQAAVLQKNGSTLPGRRHMTSPAEMLLRTERTWDLDVWELKGPPDTWAAQLDDFYRRQPVFALVSGVSNGSWEPVHAFCERERVPCWFPSADLVPEEGAYSLYFSRGVALEAEVLAKHLKDAGGARPHRLVQVYRDGYVGGGAAAALRAAMSGSGIVLEDRILRGDGVAALETALKGIGAGDSVMFWLRPADVAGLERVPLPRVEAVYFSGALAEGDRAPIPDAWKVKARLIYPFQLPGRRVANLAYFHAWLKLRGIPLVDERLQSEAYFALNFLTDTLAEMLDNLYRDYLIERAEDMIGRREGSKAEEEARDRPNLGWHARRPGAVRTLVRQNAIPANASGEGTTIYPRLNLGPSQRFASKGGYIVGFAADGKTLVAKSDWIVP